MVSNRYDAFLVVCTCITSFIIYVSARYNSNKAHLPPGPRGSIILGIKSRFPTTVPWKRYAEWSRLYHSTVISFRLYSHRIIVLNSKEAVNDLLNKRASLYSDRPVLWMYHEICDRKKSVFNIAATDERHKLYRKTLQMGLGPRAVEQYWPVLESETTALLDRLSESPNCYHEYIRRYTAATIMKVAFGYTITDDQDFFLRVAKESGKIVHEASASGRWLVDYFPALRFIPSWFPGAGFKRQGNIWRSQLDALSGIPHEWAKRQMAEGKNVPSFTSRLLQSDSQPSEDEETVKWCAAGLYAGASDTTVAGLVSFVTLMALHSDVQEKAFAEIRDNVGTERLPSPSDLSRLPYLQALMKEVLRVAPIAPLALPHRVIQDDEYLGYRIPRGSSIIPNTWAILHDPGDYPDPVIFDPSRFIPSEDGSVQPDPRAYAFGYGRRTCPGYAFAETSMALVMANMLATFRITPYHSLPDQIKSSDLEVTTGITSHIKPFALNFIRRND